MSEEVYKIIRVMASKSYDVLIGRNFLDNVGKIIKDDISPCKVGLITDDIVNDLYTERVKKSLTSSGYDVNVFVFKNGEESKNIFTFADIQNFLAENQFTRTDMVIALGGGVVGDMAGFVSATYMRGIKFIQIPTTLLSQIDSSVGGKTAIDLKNGKNLVGAFYQPELVLCDIDTLNSLPENIFNDGMGEVVKYALLSKKIYNFLETGEENLSELVSLCVEYKRNIVCEDEFEGGKRKLLNLGHTIAHAIENLSGYTIPHGRAVKMGVAEILRISVSHNFISKEECDKIEKVIFSKLKKEYSPYPMSEICKITNNDKKCKGDKITLVVCHGVGDIRLKDIKKSKTEEYFI